MPKAQPSSLTGMVAKGNVAPEFQRHGQETSGGVTLSITRESPNVDADLSTADKLEEEYFRESGALELVTRCDKQLGLSAYFPDTSRNIARFQERFLAIVSEPVDYPRQLPFPNYKQLTRNQRAMSTAFYTICNTSSASSITKLLLPAVPTQVQDLFGKISPKFEDLLGLPEPTALEKTRWLVYFDGTVRWEMEDHPDDPFIRRRTGVIVRRGKYVGSSVDYRGGGVRLDRHTHLNETTVVLQNQEIRLDRGDHELWLAAGNADVYGNPACAAAHVPGSSFTGFMADARCANCADYLNQQAGKSIPKSQRRERQPQAKELEARNHSWTREEDDLLQSLVTTSIAKTAWKKLAVDYFPQMTAQSLKERFALLRAEARKVARKVPNTTPTANRASKSRKLQKQRNFSAAND
ncbi:hypothetical protein FCOIX_5092 [Fusarium coicis]|nr:hypothetical protein FCOIX_5092 [Fusarium coicis]